MPSMWRYFIWLTVRAETVGRSGDRTVQFEHLHHLAALDHVFAFAQPAQLVDHGLQDVETLRCLDQRDEQSCSLRSHSRPKGARCAHRILQCELRLARSKRV